MQFVVQSGAEPGKTYDLVPNKKYSIGRQSANDIVVSDEQVSRRHAEVQVIPNGILVTDLGSSNGTFINGTRVSSPQTIGPGDTLQVGTTVLRLVDSQNADSTLPAGYDQPAPLSSSSYGTVNLGTPSAAAFSPANPSTSSFPAYGQGQQGAANPSFGQNGAQSGAFGQSSPANPTYGQSSSPSSTFGQSNTGMQGFNQAQPPSSSASYSPAPAGSNSYNNNAFPANAYVNNAANPAANAAKKGLPQPLIIGIVVAVVVVIVLLLIVFLVLGNHSGSSTTSLILPNSLMLTLYNLAMLL